MKASGKLNVVSLPFSNGIQYIGMNVTKPPFDNPKVRQAVAYAIPYQKIMDAVMFGLANPMFGAAKDKPTEVAWPQPHKYNTDMEKAKALMAEAGYANGFDTTISFDLNFAGVNEPLCVLRQAVAYAIPYQKIMDAVMFGLANPMFGAAKDKPTEVAWPQPHKYNTDMEKAKALMAEAGYANGFDTTISFDLNFAGVNEPLCVLVQESLAQIGIKTTINKVPGANWRTELNKKEMPLFTNVFSGWLDYPEYFFYWCYHGNNSVFNTMSYKSAAMDKLIDGARAAAATGDTATYDTDVKGFVDLAYSDIPRIPLYQPFVNVAMQKNISGYQYWFHRRLDYRAMAKG
ncbi:Dipeptidebinding ABC transporter periplasmic substratebinding component TC 3A152 [Bradyrhizobium sp.]|nr:Dipeptidebinding ABC transporter periplasmic substratebinding component TC 3A152 [Bradyrhizobium sp.]